MRTLAIDFGTKRLGLALSDEGGSLASPYAVIEVRSHGQAIDLIQQIITREGIKRLVVGLPLNMDGTAGPAARRVMDWARQIKGPPLLFVDERLSSFSADQQLIARKRAGEKLTRKRKKRRIDALAAAAFLQAYLDGKLPEIKQADLSS